MAECGGANWLERSPCSFLHKLSLILFGELCGNGYFCGSNPLLRMSFSSGKRWVIFTTWLKYITASALFVLLTGFVGEHSIRQRISRKREIATLRQTIAQLQARFAQDKAKLDLLKSDLGEIRRVARERYYMRTEGEDVFIIMDEP